MKTRILFHLFLLTFVIGFVHLAGSEHVMVQGSDVKWVDSPNLGPGVQMAVLEGDPSAMSGSYTVRLKMPDGYKVAPHWHPADENVVVISGNFMLGMGEKFDESAMQSVTSGGYVEIPKEMRHYGMSKGETILHIYGTSPFKIIYVNPADDPAKKMGSQ